MDSSKSLDEKIKIDNNLSNRYIDLDPNGYFIIKVDLEENKIVLEHFLNNIDEEGYALDPETNELDVRIPGRKWMGSKPAKEEFEKNLINDFC